MKKITTNTAEIILEDQGFVNYRYLPFAEVNIEEAKENYAAAIKLTGGKKYPTIVDARTLMHVSKEARTFSASPDITKGSVAAAIVVETSVSKFLANMFVKFNKPGYPVKIFTDKKTAMKWLTPYIKGH